VLIAACGCKSAEERCAEATEPARQAWQAYLDALEARKSEAQADGKRTAAELEKVEKRIDDAARTKANTLTKPGEMAWYRTYDAQRQSLCADDPQCAGLKGKVRQAELVAQDMDARIGATRAVLEALSEPKKGKDLPGVEDDFDRRDLLSAARDTNRGVPEACADVAK